MMSQRMMMDNNEWIRNAYRSVNAAYCLLITLLMLSIVECANRSRHRCSSHARSFTFVSALVSSERSVSFRGGVGWYAFGELYIDISVYKQDGAVLRQLAGVKWSYEKGENQRIERSSNNK